jgi:hypothetical protein
MQGARVLRNEAYMECVAVTKDARTTATEQVDFLHCRQDVERRCVLCQDLTEQVLSEKAPGRAEDWEDAERRTKPPLRMTSQAVA